MNEVVLTTKEELTHLIKQAVREVVKAETKNVTIRNYMTEEQTAELLGVHVSTISRAAKAGELKYYNIGRMKFFDKENLFTESGQNTKLFKKRGIRDY